MDTQKIHLCALALRSIFLLLSLDTLVKCLTIFFKQINEIFFALELKKYTLMQKA